MTQTVAADIDALLTEIHDHHMNNYGFLRNVDGQWKPSGSISDEVGGSKANAIYAARSAVRQYFAASVDRSPEGQDAVERLDAKHESAVAKPDAQGGPHDPTI